MPLPRGPPPGGHQNLELRDHRLAVFVNDLPRGRHTLRHRLRAETPGSFHVLPTEAAAMYAPAIRGRTTYDRWEIR